MFLKNKWFLMSLFAAEKKKAKAKGKKKCHTKTIRGGKSRSN
jgi:hypothetical protein